MNIRRRHLATALGAAVLGGAGWYLAQGTSGTTTAPSLTYTLLDGSRHSSQEWQGKVMLVNFWATSCTTCVKEMPHMVSTFQKFRSRGLDTLAVAMSYDPPAYVSSFAQTRQLPFGVAIDNTGEIASLFGSVQLTPTTFVIDKQRRIVKRYVGEPDFAALHQLLDRLLTAA